jgi:hypothetical protein
MLTNKGIHAVDPNEGEDDDEEKEGEDSEDLSAA